MMKEAEYILVSDLKAVSQARECLRGITPENSTRWLKREEWLLVQQALSRWQDELFAKVSKAMETGR